jgi:ribosomal protein S18 acetylase RimI-like enzyme
MFSIRPATIEDAFLIADISHETFRETFACSNTPQDMDKFLLEQFTKGKLMLEVGAAGNEFYLATEGNTIAGYVKLRDAQKPAVLRDCPALEIARIYCCQNMQGKGIGKMLMQKSIDVALSKNKKAVWLGVWEKNFRAIAFYEKWGFEKIGETDFLLGDDLQNDWLMKKMI